MKSTPLKNSIGYGARVTSDALHDLTQSVASSHLAPGATTLLPKISEPSSAGTVDPNTMVRHLTVDDWAVVVKAFDEWPFAPEVNME